MIGCFGFLFTQRHASRSGIFTHVHVKCFCAFMLVTVPLVSNGSVHGLYGSTHVY